MKAGARGTAAHEPRLFKRSRRGGPEARAPTNKRSHKISPTDLTWPLSEPVQHTGDFEEFRNFGMCLDLVGAAALKRDASLVEQGGYLVGSNRPLHEGTPAELVKLAEANSAAMARGEYREGRGSSETRDAQHRLWAPELRSLAAQSPAEPTELACSA